MADPICQECEQPIPLGNGARSHHQQRSYCGIVCRDKAAQRRARAKRYTLQSLIDEGFSVQMDPIEDRIRGRAIQGKLSHTETGATVQIVLEKLWKAIQNWNRGGRSKASGSSSSTT